MASLAHGPGMAQSILLGPNHYKFGTAEVAATFGTVLKADLTEKVDEFVFEDNNGDAAAVLLHNHTLELELTLLFDNTATVLTIGAQIDFPIAGVKGNVTQIKTSRENKGGKQITITAKNWLSMGNVTPATV